MRAGNAPRRQQGITYLWMLFLLFLLALGMGKSLELYSFVLKREKEADKRLQEETCDQALLAYYEHSPGYRKDWPTKESDLLLDPRLLTTTRYLRSPDPLYPCPAPGRAMPGASSHPMQHLTHKSFSGKDPVLTASQKNDLSNQDILSAEPLYDKDNH